MMGCACSLNGRDGKCVHYFDWKHIGEQPFRKLRRIWKYGIHIKDVNGEGLYIVMCIVSCDDAVRFDYIICLSLRKLFAVKLSSEVAFVLCQLVIANNMLRTCKR